jgi:hypothetical protein
MNDDDVERFIICVHVVSSSEDQNSESMQLTRTARSTAMSSGEDSFVLCAQVTLCFALYVVAYCAVLGRRPQAP